MPTPGRITIHHRALQAYISGPSVTWRRRIGRPRQSWLRSTVEADDLRPVNLGLATIGLAVTRVNSYVVSDTLLKKESGVVYL